MPNAFAHIELNTGDLSWQEILFRAATRTERSAPEGELVLGLTKHGGIIGRPG